MSVEIAWKQNILVTDFHLLKSLLVVLGFGSQAFVCGFSRQNINSVILLNVPSKNPECLSYCILEALLCYMKEEYCYKYECQKQECNFDPLSYYLCRFSYSLKIHRSQIQLEHEPNT